MKAEDARREESAGPLRPVAEQAERIAAARAAAGEAGVRLFVSEGVPRGALS
ncbi:hypothetical protein [Streptomyces incarnatus]|uniref:hypothetical protein n=1 Tax=Streptomyces incarnatus TaxID=665007 RepID=UPI0024466DFC|nr:hypothetical protein [Streptomyces incarnatus]